MVSDWDSGSVHSEHGPSVTMDAVTHSHANIAPYTNDFENENTVSDDGWGSDIDYDDDDESTLTKSVSDADVNIGSNISGSCDMKAGSPPAKVVMVH